MDSDRKYFKMYGKTSSDKTHLCKTCYNGTELIFNNNVKLTHCAKIDIKISRNVVECSGYYNKALPSLKTLYETAYILETDQKKGIGFKRYIQWKKGNEKESEEVEFN